MYYRSEYPSLLGFRLEFGDLQRQNCAIFALSVLCTLRRDNLACVGQPLFRCELSTKCVLLEPHPVGFWATFVRFKRKAWNTSLDDEAIFFIFLRSWRSVAVLVATSTAGLN